MENELKKIIEQLLLEIRWIQRNMNPPVNYPLIMIVSAITAVITIIIALRL